MDSFSLLITVARQPAVAPTNPKQQLKEIWNRFNKINDRSHTHPAPTVPNVSGGSTWRIHLGRFSRGHPQVVPFLEKPSPWKPALRNVAPPAGLRASLQQQSSCWPSEDLPDVPSAPALGLAGFQGPGQQGLLALLLRRGLQQRHQSVSLLHHLQHLLQDQALLQQLPLILEAVCRGHQRSWSRSSGAPGTAWTGVLSLPSTVILPRSSCCRLLCWSSSSSSRALKDSRTWL